jgi:hypothetical protein
MKHVLRTRGSRDFFEEVPLLGIPRHPSLHEFDITVENELALEEEPCVAVIAWINDRAPLETGHGHGGARSHGAVGDAPRALPCDR